ncbi:tetratricopeptide repeat protein [uncultured Roseobacter sp.]|uniref:adenylate/guanylate cyclase domain-containing protein n=2 Tax=uncultured Roseobacter sp. TaxID=114847 RepID=UPI00261C040F|nr:tetratricopeptide repeat protein [uncultured Roseobacter sp.]
MMRGTTARLSESGGALPPGAGPVGHKERGDQENANHLCVAFADVVGFSAMMHEDEQGTFQRWTGLREKVILPLLEKFDGKLVKSTGDGILATFDDAVAGVKWSLELQSQARKRRQGLSLRVSLNYCSVLRDGNDLLGDGVNVAARLQEHTSPGGVILTQSVQDEIEGLATYETTSVGPLKLRKLGKLFSAFQLKTDGRHLQDPTPGVTDLPSLAVMPFVNLGGNQEDDYLAAGIVEDIVVSLSSHRDLTVISRSSTLAFARQPINPKEVGEVLGVRYLITGTLRRSNDRIRISAQLLDTAIGKQLASLRRDFKARDMFSVQDEIVETALVLLLPEMHSEERRRALRKWPSSWSGYDNYLKALDLIGSLKPKSFELARTHLNRAIDTDPGFSSPLAWAARWYSLRIGQGWSKDPRQDSSTAADLALQAIRIDENNALAHATYGHVRSYLFGDFDTAIEHLDRARKINPNSSTASLLSSVTLSSMGRCDEAVTAAERALRLSPFDQWLFMHYVFLGIVHYDAGNYEQALSWLSRGIAENDRYTTAFRVLAVTQVALGDELEARRTTQRLMQREPNFRLSDYKHTHKLYQDPHRAEQFRMRLRQAGVPD